MAAMPICALGCALPFDSGTRGPSRRNTRFMSHRRGQFRLVASAAPKSIARGILRKEG
jgi:hypothetical protein